jgi:hypothetical protein
MRLVNNLAKPGDIRRVDLSKDTVKIILYNGQELVYRLSCAMPTGVVQKDDGNGS